MKILDITGNPFSAVLNNGKTHEALFSAFGKSELCQLYTRPVDNSLIDFDYCGSYYCVSDFDVLKKLTFRSSSCGGEIIKDADVNNQGGQYIDFKERKVSAHQDLMRLLRDYMWHTNVWKTDALKVWLQREKPDLVFVDGGGECFIYDIALFVSDLLQIPLVSYYTDDYLITPLVKGLISNIRHCRLEKTLKKVVYHSAFCYTIGEEMASEYKKFFKKDFGYIMNSIALRPYVEPNESLDKIRVSYFGSLGLNRDKMICKLAKILKGYADVYVYTFAALTHEELNQMKEHGVIVKEGVKDNAFHDEVYKSDVLLHVESDDEKNRAFTRLAVSTKIPEYLMHSRPVLGFGPAEVASMKILSNNDVGIVVSSEADEQSIKGTISLLYDKSNRIKYAQKGFAYACEFFDRNKNANRFKKQIINIINGK